jgi:hypothetical protein
MTNANTQSLRRTPPVCTTGGATHRRARRAHHAASRVDLALTLLLVLGTAHVGLASPPRWVGDLHLLFALVVLGLAAVFALRLVGRRPAARHLGTS